MQSSFLHIVSGPLATAELVVWLVALAATYLLPFWVALARSSPETGRVLLVNLAAGWTVLGWLQALRIALGLEDKPSAETARARLRERRRARRQRPGRAPA